MKDDRERRVTYNFGHVTFVTVRFHVPDDLVAEQLRYLGGLEDEIGNIAYGEERLRINNREVDMTNLPRSSYRRA